MNQFLFEHWQHPQQRQINHFYKSHNQNVSCHNLDLIYLARNTSKNVDEAPIIAVTFIRKISTKTEDLQLLRSLYVAPHYRGQGVAKELLAYVLQDYLLQERRLQANKLLDQGSALTVICKPNLTNLYTNAGFCISKPALLSNSPYLAKFAQQQKVILTKSNTL
jgi:GNAT superfamily N-acetyltransferase